MDAVTAAQRADALRALHVPGQPLVLPNAWDAASARAVQAAGFPAVATASAAIAASLGYEDGEQMPVDELFAAVARIARSVEVPVTADIESGYGCPPEELVARLLAAGAVGCNLEDTDHRAGGLIDASRQADRLAAFREAALKSGVSIVLNARVDVYAHDESILDASVKNAVVPGGQLDGEQSGNTTAAMAKRERARLEQAVRRGRLYAAAGADCIYPILVTDDATITALVHGIGAPINIYAQPSAPALPRLAALGVARVSYGPWIQRLAVRATQSILARIRTGESPYDSR